jgi:hypothetical protein
MYNVELNSSSYLQNSKLENLKLQF